MESTNSGFAREWQTPTRWQRIIYRRIHHKMLPFILFIVPFIITIFRLFSAFPFHPPQLTHLTRGASISNSMLLEMMRTLDMHSAHRRVRVRARRGASPTTLLINIEFDWSTCRMGIARAPFTARFRVDVLSRQSFAENAARYPSRKCSNMCRW